jgi:predicted RNase H-like HicB family nuclease
MPTYIAVIHKDPNSDYGVSYPDLPGCISAGSSLEEARAMAAEALAAHLEIMREHGDNIPTPSGLDEVQRHEFAEDALLFLSVEVDVEAVPRRINVSLPSDLIERIDRAAKSRGMTRSGFLATAARKELHG